ncbi:DUF1345 domain-containing protein [Hydrogenophaga sp.]|uniref:DUF1345 domain-containing protein n=1 Tax=Hydrogenophaga sp. TaxID=1904254 RepID=UPI00286DCC70|nr:DUF1345 domain-containing protein [Hydrogenophaga sp.]
MNQHPMHGLHWSARFTAWQRQGAALLPALLAGGAAAVWPGASGATPWLLGWVVYCGVYTGLVWRLARHLDAAGTHRRARWEDPGAAMLLVLVTSAACASLLAVALAVDGVRALQGGPRAVRLGLVLASLAGAWLLIQSVFALHYARRYYHPTGASRAPARGLLWPGGEDPDYLDFFYHSAVVGMTSQVADVTPQSRAMRHLTLLHGLLSFAFNLIVLAMAVNVLASALG